MQAWSPFYWADYVADTSQLSLVEHGAYFMLMAHYYNTRKPLPANASILHRVCRATTDAEQEAVAVVLTAYFRRDGDVYRHNRIDKELDKSFKISSLRRDAANKRHHANACANAPILHTRLHTQSQSQSQLQSQSQSQSEPQKPKSKSFVRPTIQEVTAYCSERNNKVDPAKWFDYYSSNGWHVGRNPMRDWRAAVRTWEKNGFGGTNGKLSFEERAEQEREIARNFAARASGGVAQ